MDLSLRYVAITMARRERCVVFHASALLLLITALKSLMKSLRAREKQSTLLLFFFSDAEQSHLAESSECEGRSNQNNSVLHAASHPPRLEVRGGGWKQVCVCALCVCVGARVSVCVCVQTKGLRNIWMPVIALLTRVTSQINQTWWRDC